MVFFGVWMYRPWSEEKKHRFSATVHNTFTALNVLMDHFQHVYD